MLDDAVAADAREARLGVKLQQLAELGTSRSLDDGAVGLRGHEIARLADAGVKIERLAVGMVTERNEVLVNFWSHVVVPDPGLRSVPAPPVRPASP